MEALGVILERVFSPFPDLDENYIYSLKKYLEHRFGRHTRENGEPYAIYFADVVERLSHLHVDKPTILAALLWQVYHVMDNAREEIEKFFGMEVAELAERVSRLSRIDYNASQELHMEQFRNLILALAKDIRVVFVRLVDRAHVMSMIEVYPLEQPEAAARESRELYAPLANRLGIGRIKLELEDLSLKILQPEIYLDLERKISARSSDREKYLETIKTLMKTALVNESIHAEIKGRVKHLDSIHKKMLAQKISYDEVYDIVGIRVITDSIKDCYSVLGIVHSLWKPIPKRFKDYIAVPKQNMYQSIHSSVIGPAASPLEIQIRTREMNRVAELGIAAHWQYKDHEINRRYQEKFAWMRQAMEWLKDKNDPIQAVEMFKVDLFPDEVYVFTPMGEVRCLPKGSSVIDFAFMIHSDVGYQCKGANVNQKFVPLKTQLCNGDIVEIITSKTAKPNANWLQHVKTSHARNRIRKYLRTRARDQMIHIGKEILFKHLKKMRIRTTGILGSEAFLAVVEQFGLQSGEDLLSAVGFGELSCTQVANRLSLKMVKPVKQPRKSSQQLPKKQGLVSISGETDLEIRFARCCEPIPGEEIVGYITFGRGVSVHAKRCANLNKLESNRIVKADWEASDRPGYPVKITFEGHKLPGLMTRITDVLIASGAQVISHKLSEHRKAHAFIRGQIQIEITSYANLEEILREIREIPGVFTADRVLAR